MEQQEIRLEYSMLINPLNCPEGLYVMPSPDQIHVWHGVMFITHGPYVGAIFRFILTIPASFPKCGAHLPAVHILSDCFHPLVDPDGGRFDVRTRFGGKWRARQDHLLDVLRFVKEGFREKEIAKVSEAQASNKEAWRTFHHQPALFATTAQQSAHLSRAPSTLYEFSSHPNGRRAGKDQPIVFKRMKDDEYEKVRERIRAVATGGVQSPSTR